MYSYVVNTILIFYSVQPEQVRGTTRQVSTWRNFMPSRECCKSCRR